MKSLSYYSVQNSEKGDINKCSMASSEYPLIVNCAGNFRTPFPFSTNNPSGRKDFYIMAIQKGELEIPLDGKGFIARSGSVIIFPPDYPYSYSYFGGEPLEYLWVHFTGSYAPSLLEECGFSPLPFFAVAESDHRISDKFSKLFEAFEAKRRLQRQELACILEQIVLSASKTIFSDDNPRTLEKSVRYIHSSYNKKISIPELAAMENLSNSRYISLFNQCMGISPSAYIIGLRIGAACDLLETTDMSIKQIGILVGYSDSHFFSKLFKKHVGVSPKDYKFKNKKS